MPCPFSSNTISSRRGSIIDEYDLLGVTLDETQVEKEGFEPSLRIYFLRKLFIAALSGMGETCGSTG